MKRLLLSMLLIGSLAIGQEFQEAAVSPRQTLKQNFSVTNVTVDYSRPSVNERKIFGDLVPFGNIWRLGANAATTIEFGLDIIFNDQTVTAGKYTLFATPHADYWTLHFSRMTNARGTSNYDPNLDIFTVTLKLSQIDEPVESFQIRFDNFEENQMEMYFEWANTRAHTTLRLANDADVQKISEEMKHKREKEQKEQQNLQDNRPRVKPTNTTPQPMR
ncbi:MAG: DUF2911 domain-containing protein [Weeksellaceae bacterium]|nr:DUF2911 domain-containing protein [Weeksellaceae bacterium]